MINRETWGVALDALRVNKLKAALTMLGVMIGSACVVLVVTVALIGKSYVIGQIEGVGSNLIYAYRPSQLKFTLADEITIPDLEVVRELPHVVEAAGTHDIVDASVVVNGKEFPVGFIGITAGFQKIRNLLILKGRFFDQVDMDTPAKACLITQNLANHFPGDMIGKAIRVGELQFTVIGIFRERVSTFGESEIKSDSVLIPFPLVKYYKGAEYLRVLYAQADSPQTVPLVTEEIQHLLQSRHRKSAIYNVRNLSAMLETARKMSMALTAVLLMVACVALVVSGVGIMNIMLVTVTERTQEIGLRKSVGAKRTDILLQFLIEALLISGTGALLGIVSIVSMKIVIDPLVPAEYNFRLPISFASIVVSFTASCATGVLFGYIPASRASKLQPIEALRHE